MLTSPTWGDALQNAMWVNAGETRTGGNGKTAKWEIEITVMGRRLTGLDRKMRVLPVVNRGDGNGQWEMESSNT